MNSDFRTIVTFSQNKQTRKTNNTKAAQIHLLNGRSLTLFMVTTLFSTWIFVILLKRFTSVANVTIRYCWFYKNSVLFAKASTWYDIYILLIVAKNIMIQRYDKYLYHEQSHEESYTMKRLTKVENKNVWLLLREVQMRKEKGGC